MKEPLVPKASCRGVHDVVDLEQGWFKQVPALDSLEDFWQHSVSVAHRRTARVGFRKL